VAREVEGPSRWSISPSIGPSCLPPSTTRPECLQPFRSTEAKGLELSQARAQRCGSKLLSRRIELWLGKILHDVPCSAIPYELLAFKTGEDRIYHPALEVGMCRRLASQDASPPASYSAKTLYRLLIVADPTDNLPGTRKEAEAIVAALKKEFGAEDCVPGFEIKSMIGSREASLSSVLAEIGPGQYDFIHYAGHGNHDPHNPKKSGLLFKQGYLTALELKETVAQRRKARKAAEAAGGSDAAATHPPALVLLNACLAVNMIVKVKNQAFNQASLAQAVLEGRGLRVHWQSLAGGRSVRCSLCHQRLLAHGQRHATGGSRPPLQVRTLQTGTRRLGELRVVQYPGNPALNVAHTETWPLLQGDPPVHGDRAKEGIVFDE